MRTGGSSVLLHGVLLSGFVSFFLHVPQGEAQVVQRGVVINEKTKQCAQYWSGDECTKVTVPEGWKPLPAVWDEKRTASFISYSGKECAWRPKGEAQCCKEFGLTYLPEMRLATTKSGLENDPKSACYQLPGQVPAS